jgi:hypothetical protein
MLASCLVVLSGATPASASGPSTGSILSAVNSARASAGRRPLSLRSDLSAVAYRWSANMAARNTLQHNPNLTSQVHGWRWVGENVGYGPDWSRVQVAFMNSPGHRSNILDRDYSQIGIGVVVRNGRVWITQVFRSPSGAGSVAKAKPKPRPKPSARPTASKPRVRTTTDGKPAGRPVRRAAPKPAATPTELLQRRITSATQQRGIASSDPLSAALDFAAAMRMVGGASAG